MQDYLKYADEIATKHAATKPVAINESKAAAPAPFSLVQLLCLLRLRRLLPRGVELLVFVWCGQEA